MSPKATPEKAFRVKPAPHRKGAAATFARTGPITFDEFCVVIKPEQKADLIDGVIYMASPENFDAHRLYLWLMKLFMEFVERSDLGEVFGSRAAFKMDEKNSPEPDIAFVRKDRLHLVRKAHFEGPPDLAIEIVSPESAERDYVKKRALYERAGVVEYWIIDEELHKVALLRRGRDRKYHEIRPTKGGLHSQVLPGFWLKPEWLWAKPRANTTKLLLQMLSAS
ncbi:MAG TPA: Uma2 family endonuclease [Isosphaeraceae bacterium]|jgi:Uma2 family endonuclease|nr:Uma2 family endonuclease [Isosphaeraceae bacterium]